MEPETFLFSSQEPLLIRILSQLHPLHTTQRYFKLVFSIILQFTSKVFKLRPFPTGFSTECCICTNLSSPMYGKESVNTSQMEVEQL
jgi:hypothetical protein